LKKIKNKNTAMKIYNYLFIDFITNNQDCLKNLFSTSFGLDKKNVKKNKKIICRRKNRLKLTSKN